MAFVDIPTPVVVRAEVTADNTSIRVLWEWSNEGHTHMHTGAFTNSGSRIF